MGIVILLALGEEVTLPSLLRVGLGVFLGSILSLKLLNVFHHSNWLVNLSLVLICSVLCGWIIAPRDGERQN